MAFVKCKGCGEWIHEASTACTQCGHKVARRSRLSIWIVLGGFVLLIVIAGGISSFKDQKPGRGHSYRTVTQKPQQKSPEELRKEKIERHFSSWDGSHRGLTRFIKDAMNDPGSYKHVDTSYVDKGDYLKVKATYRGKNVFGGVVKNWIWAKVDLEGNVVEVIAQGH